MPGTSPAMKGNAGRTMRLPREIGPIHFIGIGGIGMSGIAEVLSNLGYSVQGSDAADGYNLDRLRKNGVKVSVGHKADNVAGAEKAPMVAMALGGAGRVQVPAAGVSGRLQTLWLLDEAAASKLPRELRRR